MTDMLHVPEIISFPLTSITVPEQRDRAAATADATLINSIELQGLLNPIIIREDGTLIAGERRLDAHRRLGRSHIPARIFEQLSPIDQMEIELLENIAREQLSWQEEVQAVARYHTAREAAFAGWTQTGTASSLGKTQTYVSVALTIAEAMDDPEVAACPTKQGALNLISHRADRARIAAMSRGIEVAGMTQAILVPAATNPNSTKEERTAALLQSIDLTKKAGETLSGLDQRIAQIKQGHLAAAALKQTYVQDVASNSVICADFLEWASEYTGERFEVAHIDFPYGKGYTGSRTRRTGKAHLNPVYADDPDIFLGLVEGFLAVQDRILFPIAHVLFWYDMQYHDWTIKQFEAAGWTLVQPHPFIWTKPAQGVASDVNRRMRHCYEACLLFSRGDRKTTNLIIDWKECRVDEKLHLNQKPIDLLEYLLSSVVDEHTALLDPTCGSGSALAAAERLKARRIFGVELDPNNAEVAKFVLSRHLYAKEEVSDTTTEV